MLYEVVFVHHQPSLRNIGDELCSPRHYFDFIEPRARIAIIGGGVFSDLGEKALDRLRIPASDAVLWGVGRSVKRAGDRLQVIENLPHLAWGLRDLDGVADASHFLPCVSCLHPMLDVPVAGDKTLLFVNADQRVTREADVPALQRLAAEKGWSFLQNSCSDEEMQAALAGCTRVVTNSFHGAYWSLLSGHAVKVIGYSSKFESLFRALRLPVNALLRYEKPRKHAWLTRWLARGPETSELVTQLMHMGGEDGFVALPDAAAVRREFREMNLRFAQGLVDLGAFGDVRLKHVHHQGSA